MERQGIGEALTILMLLGVAVVISTIIWNQMYKQVSIESIKTEYTIIDLMLIRFDNATHTNAYLSLTLMNTGTMPFKETKFTLKYGNGTIIYTNSTNDLIEAGERLIRKEVIQGIDKNRLDESYILDIDARSTNGSEYGLVRKVRLSL